MVTETDRNKARSAVVSAYHALDCVGMSVPFLHAFADAAVDAVSTDAEPVAIYKGNGLVDCGDSGHHNIELLKLIPANTPLYAEPVKTAPAVAVPQILVNLATAVLAQAPANATEFMGIGLDDIRSALSAQVQDVAGWQDFCNAPKDGSKFDVWYAPRLGLEGYRRVDVYWSDIQDTFCTDGSFGPDEPCPILMHPGPTHWMSLPASPASKHGDAE